MSQVYLSLLPQQQQYFTQFYQLEYKKIGQNMMLVILSNITETRSLQQALQQQQQDAAFVVYSLTHETEVRQTLLAFDAFLQQQQRVTPRCDAEEHSGLFRELHTFKGLLAQIQCPQLPADIHQAEERLLQLGQQATLSGDSTRLAVFAALRERFEQVRTLLCEHLGSQFLQAEPQLKVPASLFQQICQVLNRSHPDLVVKLRQTEFKPLADLLAGHLAAAKRLALSQQKELAVQMQLDVPLWLDAECYQPLFAVLVHLFRNSVDHGCELPGVRLAQGKSAVATLTVTAQLTEVDFRESMPGHASVVSEQSAPADSLLLLIRDDGQGIALDGIRQQIVQRGLLSAVDAAALNEPALLNYIFAEHFSTKQEVSEISGRGVGLAAVRQVLQQYGGQISVSTEPGQGSCFVLTVPLLPGHYVSQSSRQSVSAESSALG